jgi:hypothetical protein
MNNEAQAFEQAKAERLLAESKRDDRPLVRVFDHGESHQSSVEE